MKLRKGFISNSSTTSFIIVGLKPSETELKRLTKDAFEKFKKEYLESYNRDEVARQNKTISELTGEKCEEPAEQPDKDDIWEEFLYEYEGPNGLSIHKCEGTDDICIGDVTSVDYSETFNVNYFSKAATKVAKALGVPVSKIKVFVEYSGQM